MSSVRSPRDAYIYIYIYDEGRPPKFAYISHSGVSIDKKKKKKKCILSWNREHKCLLRFQLTQPSNNSETCFQFVWLHAHRQPAYPFTSHHLSDRRLVIYACSAAFGYDPLVASMFMKPIKALFCCSTFESLHRHSSKPWSLPNLLRLKVVYQVYIYVCVQLCICQISTLYISSTTYQNVPFDPKLLTALGHLQWRLHFWSTQLNMASPNPWWRLGSISWDSGAIITELASLQHRSRNEKRLLSGITTQHLPALDQ